jgi:uridine kinase
MAVVIERAMREIQQEGRRFVRQTVTIEEIESYFRARGHEDKLLLLSTRRSSTAHTITCGEFVDLAHGPYVRDTGCLPTFGVIPHGDGLVLRFPRRLDRNRLPDFTPRELLFRTYTETRQWEEVLGIHHVGQLNRLCLNGDIARIIRVAEALHEKKIAMIADQILSRNPSVRVVMVAGPSASGKTTFARRLGVQLRVNGVAPLALSLDNYYVDRDRTPRGEDGRPDFETIEAVDLALFHSQLDELLAGREVNTPRFDFLGGARRPQHEWVPMRLGDDQVLVVEGIHGLNDRVTGAMPGGYQFKIYVSALSQLAIDDHNRIFTADARIIRRIVRDQLFRGFSAERTLGLWEKVRSGEARWIFPFQEHADVMFNSALVYEPAVLKTFAERFLLHVPRTSDSYPEAFRLLKFLSMFVPIFPDEVPQTSILREFIGGSSFRD